MKIHTVFITYNRLELTKQAIESYLETVTLPYTLMVVDNDSRDGTVDWLGENVDHWWSFSENHYPGFAANFGFTTAADDTTHLHRADNDFAFLPGWCKQVEAAFGSNPKLGQLGLRTSKEEYDSHFNVGGCMVMRRELWDAGIRYDERPWGEYEPGYSEDSYLTPAIVKAGYEWKRVSRPALISLATGDWGDPYYQSSYGVRGIRPHPEDPTLTDELRETLL